MTHIAGVSGAMIYERPFFPVLPIPGRQTEISLERPAYPAEAALPGMLGVCYPEAIVHP